MNRVRIQIESGAIVDSFSSYGFIYLDSDKRVGIPEKECDATSYPEKDGENIDPRTTYAPFDYKVKFLIQAPSGNLNSANQRIRTFNGLVRASTGEGDIRRKKQIAIYDTRHDCKVVGYPEPIAEAEEMYYSPDIGRLDFVVAELVIHVSEPQLCRFGN